MNSFNRQNLMQNEVEHLFRIKSLLEICRGSWNGGGFSICQIVPQPREIGIMSRDLMSLISDIKLIKSDTTLDPTLKAEKGTMHLQMQPCAIWMHSSITRLPLPIHMGTCHSCNCIPVVTLVKHLFSLDEWSLNYFASGHEQAFIISGRTGKKHNSRDYKKLSINLVCERSLYLPIVQHV